MAVSKVIDNAIREKENETILKSLIQHDYAEQQREYRRRRQRGTGQWILDSTEYRTWLETSKQTLFCPGIPGAGKTFLTSVVVDDICDRFENDATIGIAYLYCDFRRKEKQNTEILLANLLGQLAKKQSPLPDTVKKVFSVQDQVRQTRTSLEEISTALQSVAIMFSRVFIIIDALDECQETDRNRTKLLAEIFSLQHASRSNIFATSRCIPEIMRNFESGLSLEIRARHEDIWNYLDSHMDQLPDFVTHDVVLQREIKVAIEGVIDGM